MHRREESHPDCVANLKNHIDNLNSEAQVIEDRIKNFKIAEEKKKSEQQLSAQDREDKDMLFNGVWSQLTKDDLGTVNSTAEWFGERLATAEEYKSLRARDESVELLKVDKDE